MVEIKTKRRSFNGNHRISPVIIDKNDTSVAKLFTNLKKAQDKLKKLQRIDPKIGNIFVGKQ